MRIESLLTWRRSFRHGLVACFAVGLAFEVALGPEAMAAGALRSGVGHGSLSPAGAAPPVAWEGRLSVGDPRQARKEFALPQGRRGQIVAHDQPDQFGVTSDPRRSCVVVINFRQSF